MAPRPGASRPWLKRRGRWLLSLLIAFTSCTLLATLILFVRAIPTASVIDNSDLLAVNIQYGGALRQVLTSAGTVGDLLAAQGIDWAAAGEIAPAASESLRDGMTITVLQHRSVTIVDDGSERVIKTPSENPLAILQEAGIEVSDADKIWVNGALARLAALPDWTIPAQTITIRRAARLTIIDNGAPTSIVTTAATIGDALFEAGISLYMTDEVTPPLDTSIAGPITITIERATPLELLVDGVVVAVRSNAKQVADVLTELNAPLFGLDYVSPEGDTPVRENMRIEIVRVTEEIVVETETIKYTVQWQPDATMNLDQRAVIQQGSAGKREIRSRVRYENGIEVDRVHSETVDVEAPVNRIIAYGTKAALGTVQTPQGPRGYWRRLCVYVTSYNPTSNGGNLNTSTGAILAKGVIAAKPHIIPYHTQVFVPDYGLGAIRDTGGGPPGTDYWIDLGYGPNDQYIRWRKYSYVYLLGAPPADVDYVLPDWTPASHYPGNCS